MTPRIPPGSLADTGVVNGVIARVVGLASGGDAPHLFATLGRHRRLFRPWLRFAARLMPGGTLPRSDSELVILRVAALCRCEYERRHHETLGRQAGLTADQVAGVADFPAGDWSSRQHALLTAVDQLHAIQAIDDRAWDHLADHLTEVELIELPMLVGHYVMVAMFLNALAVVPDAEHLGATGLARRVLNLRRTRPVSDRHDPTTPSQERPNEP